MDIQIDESAIADVVQSQVIETIRDGLARYETRGALVDAVSQQLIASAIGDATARAVASIDHGALTAIIAREIETAMRAAVVAIIRDGVVALIGRIRRLDEYSSQWTPAVQAALRAELFGGAA